MLISNKIDFDRYKKENFLAWQERKLKNLTGFTRKSHTIACSPGIGNRIIERRIPLEKILLEPTSL